MSRNPDFSYASYGSIPAGIETITLSDTIEYDGVQGFNPGEDGVVAVEMADGSEGLYNVKAGGIYTGLIKKFKVTGTTGVTNISAFY